MSGDRTSLLKSASGSSLVSFTVKPIVAVTAMLFTMRTSAGDTEDTVPGSTPLLPLVLLLVGFEVG